MTTILEYPVLVLNRFWQPVHTCAVRRSLHLLFTAHAEVVQVEGEERFNTHNLGSWIRYSDGFGDAERIHGARIAILVPKPVANFGARSCAGQVSQFGAQPVSE